MCYVVENKTSSINENPVVKKKKSVLKWSVACLKCDVCLNEFRDCALSKLLLLLYYYSSHSDLSMNNITELPALVFKNFPYLEELWVHAQFFLLLLMIYLLCTMLTWGLMICTWECEIVLQSTQYRCTPCPSSQLKKISAALRQVTNHSTIHELNEGAYKRCSKGEVRRRVLKKRSRDILCGFLLLGDYKGGNRTAALWGFVERHTSNLSGCLLFLSSLNTLSGSGLLGVRDKICLPDIR